MRQPRSVYRRRQAAALAGLLAFVVLLLVVVIGGGDDAGPSRGKAAAAQAKPPELPRGGRRIFPDRRVVAFYGAPQHDELGVLGIGTPREAAVKLERRIERLQAAGPERD